MLLNETFISLLRSLQKCTTFLIAPSTIELPYILSKRGRIKNKRLQAGGTLTFDEGIVLQISREGSGSADQGNSGGSSCPVRASARARAVVAYAATLVITRKLVQYI